jgi:hypothetical protein
MQYRFVALGDMIESRHRLARKQLSVQLEAVLASLNRDFASALQAPPTTIRGLDEIAGVFRDPAVVFDYLVRLNLRLFPARFRLAVVYGGLDVAANASDARPMDGPAFHHAAERIEAMKRKAQVFSIQGDGIESPTASLATILGSVHQAIISDLKPRTIETLQHIYGRPPDAHPPTQEEIAAAMGLKSRQAVSRALVRANYHILRQIEETMRQWLLTLRQA